MWSTPFSRACGIDFGTSNSTAAALRDGRAVLFPLESGRPTLPSVVFFNAEENCTRFGRAGLDDYLAGYEGRLMRALKSLLGSRLIEGQTEVGGRVLPFRDLLGQFIADVKRRADAHAERAFSEVVLGRPVHFVDDDAVADQAAEDTLAAIAREVGFKEVSFQYEPIAAAFHYETGIDREELVLVVDIGGGTSDFSLVRLSPERARMEARQDDVLANGGVHIGGTDFDRLFSLECVMPRLGYRGRLRSGREMPSSIFFTLATWHLINSAYTRQAVAEQRQLAQEAACEQTAVRLIRLLDTRAGHWLANEVEQAKIGLSGAASVDLALGRLEPGLHLPLTRDAFDAASTMLIERIAVTVGEVLGVAGVPPGRVDTVFFTGGSSGIPRLRARIAQILPGARVVEGDLFGSIGAGLAVEAARRYG